MTVEKLERYRNRYREKVSKGERPLETRGLFSQWFFTWVNPLLNIGSKLPLEFDMMPEIPLKYNQEKGSNRMRKHFKIALKKFYDSGQKSEKTFILKLVFRCFKWDILLAILLVLTLTIFEYASSYFLQKILEISADYQEEDYLKVFVILCSCLIVSKLIYAVGSENVFYFLVR
jgi:hypothetical protein